MHSSIEGALGDVQCSAHGTSGRSVHAHGDGISFLPLLPVLAHHHDGRYGTSTSARPIADATRQQRQPHGETLGTEMLSNERLELVVPRRHRAERIRENQCGPRDRRLGHDVRRVNRNRLGETSSAIRASFLALLSRLTRRSYEFVQLLPRAGSGRVAGLHTR